MRYLDRHTTDTDAINHKLKIRVMDEPGFGGAHSMYDIEWIDRIGYRNHEYISFQHGTIKEAGLNGITHEALLAILIDRLECYQAGPYACGHNHEALGALNHALRLLQLRTHERVSRGVEDTHQV